MAVHLLWSNLRTERTIRPHGLYADRPSNFGPRRAGTTTGRSIKQPQKCRSNEDEAANGMSKRYPITLGGDHAAFEAEWAASGRPDNERPDWPLPSFDARDWAKAFLDAFENGDDQFLTEDTMVGWFANALMRGYDQRSAELSDDSEGPGP